MELAAARQVFWSKVWSEDTVAAYETRKKKWQEFSTRFQRSPLDLSVSNILDYITYLGTVAKSGAPMAYSSIQAYVDFLGRAASFTHPALENPVRNPEVKLFLKGVARQLGKDVEKAEPCTLDHLARLGKWSMEQPNDPVRASVHFLALVAFWGCLRLGCLLPKRPERAWRTPSLADVRIVGSALVLTIRESKTIQFRERTHQVELPAHNDPLLCPLRAFNRWMTILLPQSSQTRLSALSSTRNELLSRSRFLDLVNKAIAPLPPLTGHSFRRGFVRLALLLGVPIDRLMHHGDWKSLEVAMSYAEDFLIPNPLAFIGQWTQGAWTSSRNSSLLTDRSYNLFGGARP
jgi:hypothetical protein